jgi:hypothetical protein
MLVLKHAKTDEIIVDKLETAASAADDKPSINDDY